MNPAEQPTKPAPVHIPCREAFQVLLGVLALLAAAFACLKTGLVWQAFGGAGVLVFAGLHLPLSLFSAAFALWMVHRHPAPALLAVASAILNALLI
ncbi:MAG: hypothetical protein KDI44_16160 [Thiothrix sp.]|nr:hypothetical protein [Thiothrix sp.]